MNTWIGSFRGPDKERRVATKPRPALIKPSPGKPLGGVPVLPACPDTPVLANLSASARPQPQRGEKRVTNCLILFLKTSNKDTTNIEKITPVVYIQYTHYIYIYIYILFFSH